MPAILLAVLVLTGAMQLALTGEPDLPEAGVGRVSFANPSLSVTPTAVAPVILARPLFGPGRGVAGGPSSAGTTALGGATVAGSIIRGRQRLLFLREADGTIITLRPGGDYRGWRLAAITEEGARFARDGELLRINYGSQAPEPAAGDDSEDSDDSE